ncbi:caspase-1 [Patella vulgata]|uniref:caspase-1 n=1 Tax=Patella vulgata TaxID=6465 RepID=UPI00217FC800|nr:caspase-1 [Patella vulgata]
MSQDLGIKAGPNCNQRCNNDTYCFHHGKRGKALIFNQSVFDDLPSRHGAKHDREKMESCFRYLNFDVVVHKECTAEEIFLYLDQEAERDHVDEDCLVCIFMSHGSDGQINARDNSIQISTIMDYFNSKSCPSLEGKPKLLFVNACRGDRLDTGIDVVDAASVEDIVEAVQMVIPVEEDFLLACSVVSGYASARDFRKGSCFVSALGEVLQKHGKSMDLMKLLTIVNAKVALEFERKGGTKQMPCVYSTLTKDVFL